MRHGLDLKGENHPSYGKKRSPETIQRLIDSHKGQPGHPMSEYTRLKLLEANIGRPRPDRSIAMIGKIVSEETRKKMSIAAKGKIVSQETRLKMSIGLRKRYENPEARKKTSMAMKNPSVETRAKMGEARKGERNNLWKGGISFEPYCIKFTKEFKERVRKFFNYICVECGTTQEENKKKLSIHHVNFDKQSCCNDTKPLFVSLCHSCHSKTNSNRVFWEYWFTEMINHLYEGRCYIEYYKE